MTSPALPQVEDLAESYVGQIQESDAGRGGVWQITGDAGSGKSVALRSIASGLRDGGRLPVLVAPPARALDSGPVGLVQMASALGELLEDHGGRDGIVEPSRPWADKISAIHEALRAAQGQVVLLCDEPRSWPATGHTHFARPAQELLARVVFDRTGCPVVVAGAVPEGHATEASEDLPARSVPAPFLTDERWGPLTDAALALHSRYDIDQLTALSPLQLRLLVAHVAVSSIDALSAWWRRETSLEELAQNLLEALAERDHELHELWLRLGRARTAFAADLPEQLGAADLEATSRALLEHCLLFRREEGLILHEALRAQALTQSPREGERRLHASLASYYTERFKDPAQEERDLRDEMEAFYHASRSGQVDFDQLKPFFVEQLNALGYHLSRDEGRYAEAAEVYRRALEWDENDDYARHYFAFNLDIEAREPERVEEGYEAAVELNPSHPWWHASRINFYIATGRLDHARTAWSDARTQFDTADAELTVNLCQDLHLRVARTLICFGQLDFADTVLRGVPPELCDEVSGYRTVERQVHARRLARDHGNFVPGPRLREGWWVEGPFLISQREGERLVQWVAGEVTDRDADGVTIDAAVIDVPIEDPEQHPPTATVTLSMEQLEEWGGAVAEELDIGDFLEMAMFETDSDVATRVRMHPQREWEDSTLPTLRPDPLRYVKTGESAE